MTRRSKSNMYSRYLLRTSTLGYVMYGQDRVYLELLSHGLAGDITESKLVGDLFASRHIPRKLYRVS